MSSLVEELGHGVSLEGQLSGLSLTYRESSIILDPRLLVCHFQNRMIRSSDACRSIPKRPLSSQGREPTGGPVIAGATEVRRQQQAVSDVRRHSTRSAQEAERRRAMAEARLRAC